MLVYKVKDENGELFCSSISKAATTIQVWVSSEDRYTDIDSAEELAIELRKGFKKGKVVQYIEHDLIVESISVY